LSVWEGIFHQEFQVPKTEGLDLIRLFLGVRFPLHKPYIQAYIGEYLDFRSLKCLVNIEYSLIPIDPNISETLILTSSDIQVRLGFDFGVITLVFQILGE